MVDCDGHCGARLDAGWDGYTVIPPRDGNRLYFCSPQCMDSWLSELT